MGFLQEHRYRDSDGEWRVGNIHNATGQEPIDGDAKMESALAKVKQNFVDGHIILDLSMAEFIGQLPLTLKRRSSI